MTRGYLRGAAAGAAGTTALNATTYLDMAIRARGASSAPEDVVEKTADKAGLGIPGQGDERANRLAALGPLSGTAVGVIVGTVAGRVHHALRKRGRSIPAPIAIVLISAAAMAMSDVPLKLLGVSDPADWAVKDWASDAVPHLVFGAVTYATLRATDDQSTLPPRGIGRLGLLPAAAPSPACPRWRWPPRRTRRPSPTASCTGRGPGAGSRCWACRNW